MVKSRQRTSFKGCARFSTALPRIIFAFGNLSMKNIFRRLWRDLWRQALTPGCFPEDGQRQHRRFFVAMLGVVSNSCGTVFTTAPRKAFRHDLDRTKRKSDRVFLDLKGSPDTTRQLRAAFCKKKAAFSDGLLPLWVAQAIYCSAIISTLTIWPVTLTVNGVNVNARVSTRIV